MFKKLVNDLKIFRGDIVLITENSLSLIRKLKVLDTENNLSVDQLCSLFLQEIIKRIGSQGTMVIQTFDWDFCEGKLFDQRSVESKTSYLGKIGLKYNDFLRTQHPMFSFAVFGEYADALAGLRNKSAFGSDSPFAFLYENNGKMITFDVPVHGSYTFVHYVEEQLKVDYRYMKTFTSSYIDKEGILESRSYDFFVRDISANVKSAMQPLEKIFLDENVMQRYNTHSIEVRQIDISKSFDVIARDIRCNSGLNLHTKG